MLIIIIETSIILIIIIIIIIESHQVLLKSDRPIWNAKTTNQLVPKGD